MSEKVAARLNLPLADADVLVLRAGDAVTLSGVLLTGRDAAHKWLVETFIHPTREVSQADHETYEKIRPILAGGAVYHCGPVVAEGGDGSYRIVAAGPTTSIREEPYQADVMRHFGVKAVIGKGGMGSGTLQACQQLPAVYLHAVGGAAAVIAACVKEVLGVYKPEFGVPEAMWLLRVENMPLVVSMDAHGNSLHESIKLISKEKFHSLIQ